MGTIPKRQHQMPLSPTNHAFYVSVIDGKRKGILLGPYADHKTALQNVERGQHLAEESNVRAAFMDFGTCSAPRDKPLKTVFGA